VKGYFVTTRSVLASSPGHGGHRHDHDHSDHDHPDPDLSGHAHEAPGHVGHGHAGHGHAGHSHGPGHVHGSTDKTRVLIAACLTGGFMVAEAAGGIITGSLALLADAGHMLTDSISLLLAWYAFHLADRKATPRLTYGFHRVKTLVAYTNGIAVFAIGAWIVVEAFHRLNDPTPVLGGPMLVIAALGHESLRNRPADALSCRRDDGDLPLQPACHDVSLMKSRCQID
jgi:hypothetical protein